MKTLFYTTISVLLFHSCVVADTPTVSAEPQDRIEGEDGEWAVMRTMDITVIDEDGQAVANAYLKPYAMRIVDGHLSDNVPRPVGDGYVIATAAPMPAGSSYGDQDPSLTWQDWAELQPDGTFTFPSMPRSGEAQLIVVCDGWLSKTTNPEAHHVEGQLFDLEPGEVDVTVDMEKTGTLELTVVGSDGRPFNTGTISSWPNQLYHKGGSTHLGSRYRTSEFSKQQLIPPDQRPASGGFINPEDPVLSFIDRPIKNGKCVLRGIPIRGLERLNLDDPEHTLIGA